MCIQGKGGIYKGKGNQFQFDTRPMAASASSGGPGLTGLRAGGVKIVASKASLFIAIGEVRNVSDFLFIIAFEGMCSRKVQ